MEDEELVEIFLKIFYEHEANGTSLGKAIEIGQNKWLELGAPSNQRMRVIEEVKKRVRERNAKDRWLKGLRNALFSDAKRAIGLGMTLEQMLETLGAEDLEPEQREVLRAGYRMIWPVAEQEVNEELVRAAQAKVVAEAEQFKQLERVERHRQKRAEEEAKRLTAERAQQERLNSAEARAEKERRKAEARRHAEELDEKRRQKEEAKRQAWLAQHLPRSVK
jgi:hypothetical protein